MSDKSANLEITCPGCDTTIVVDRVTGVVLLHKAKVRQTAGSLESMVSELSVRKTEAARRFERELESQKDRSRILEEKFKEAFARAAQERDDDPGPR